MTHQHCDKCNLGLSQTVELPRFFEALHSHWSPNIEVQKMPVPENVFYIFPAVYKKRQIGFTTIPENKRELEFYQTSIERENFRE